jgi:hypothetical protein
VGEEEGEDGRAVAGDDDDEDDDEPREQGNTAAW